MKATKHFPTSRAYSEWAFSTHSDARARHQSIEYYGGSYDMIDTIDGFRILAEGDSTNVARANALLSQFQEQIEAPSLKWEHDLAGAFPDVGHYLTGLPDAMFAQHSVPNERTPLRIWMGLTSSSGVSPEQLTARGCTLAALAIALAEVRPVYIAPFVNLGWWSDDRAGYGFGSSYRSSYDRAGEVSVISWDVQTSPLVLSELLGVTSNPHVTRYAGITACNLLNPATNGHCNPVLTNEANMRVLLGAAPSDLYIPQIHLRDPMLTDPIKWLKTMIARYSDPDTDQEY